MRISKRLLALLAAGTMFAFPVAANAELDNEITNEDETTFKLYAQDEVFASLTLEEFDKGVEHAYNYLTQFINVNRQDLQCLYYLVNRESISDEDADYLEGSLVHGTDVANGEFQNFIDAYKVINDILDHNQSTVKGYKGKINPDKIVLNSSIIELGEIKFGEYDKELLNTFLIRVINNEGYTLIDAIVDYNDYIMEIAPEKRIELGDMCLGYDKELIPYLEKVVNTGYDLKKALEEYNEKLSLEIPNKLIDPSELIYDDDDREIAHNMYLEYPKSYLPVADGTSLIENEDYELLFKQLTTLNATERKENSYELSIGPKFLVENVLGVSTINTIFDYLRENYTFEELAKYFDRKELAGQQFVVREDINIDINCPKSELEVLVLQFGQLKEFAVDTVNNGLMTTFAMKCAGKTK